MNEHNFISTNENLYCIGNNTYGQLGLNDTKCRSNLVIHPFKLVIIQIACGYSSTYFYCQPGILYSFGNNNFGQLGLGDYNSRLVPTIVMNCTQIQKISCGNMHTFIHKSTGEIYACGYNFFGQLGLGDDTDRLMFTLSMIDPTIDQITCGGHHTVFHKTNHEIYVFGCNMDGQLGLNDKMNRNIPVLCMKKKNIQQIKCGNSYTLIHTNKKIYITGIIHNKHPNNKFGKNTNIVEFKSIMNVDIKQLACGFKHVLVVDSSNHLHQLGSNTINIMKNDVQNLEKIVANRNGSIIYRCDGKIYHHRMKKKNRLIMQHENVKLINDLEIGPICWNPKKYNYLSENRKKYIITFLLICRHFFVVHNVRVVKDIKNLIIGMTF